MIILDLRSLVELLHAHIKTSTRKVYGKAEAGVMVLFFEKEDEAHLLLTLRSSTMRKHPGQIAFPGGKRETYDDTILDTALRETSEEIDLPKGKITVLGYFNDFATPYYQAVTPIIGTFEHPQNLKVQHSELTEILEVPLSDLQKDDIYHFEIWKYQGIEYKIHFYDWIKDGKHYNIWGATAEVIYQILNILE